MKNLIIIFLLFPTLLLSAQEVYESGSISSKTTVRVSSETILFLTIVDDTLHIYKSDNVISGSVYVPLTATGNAVITGVTGTIDGIPSNGIVMKPGEFSYNFGSDYALIDTLTIVAQDTALIELLIDIN
jgi:hypothetical protein